MMKPRNVRIKHDVIQKIITFINRKDISTNYKDGYVYFDNTEFMIARKYNSKVELDVLVDADWHNVGLANYTLLNKYYSMEGSEIEEGVDELIGDDIADDDFEVDEQKDVIENEDSDSLEETEDKIVESEEESVDEEPVEEEQPIIDENKTQTNTTTTHVNQNFSYNKKNKYHRK